MAVDLARIGRTHVALVAGAGGLAYGTQWLEPGSVLLGGAVMGANFWLLHLIARALRPADAGARAARRRTAVAVAAFALKFGLLLGLLAAAFSRLPVEGMSFAVGVTLLLVACVLEVGRRESAVAKGAR